MLLSAALLVVAAATATVARIDGSGVTKTTAATPNLRVTPIASAGTRRVPASTQINAYSGGYHCVGAAVRAFAKAHRPSRLVDLPGARTFTRRFAVACDRRARRRRRSGIAWYRMGAADALHDSFGQRSARAACLANFGCGASHPTIHYFEYIEKGLMEP